MFALRNFASKTVQALIEESDEEEENYREDVPTRSPRRREPLAAPSPATPAVRSVPLIPPDVATTAAAEATPAWTPPAPTAVPAATPPLLTTWTQLQGTETSEQATIGPDAGLMIVKPSPSMPVKQRPQSDISAMPTSMPSASTVAPSTSSVSAASSPAPSDTPDAQEPPRQGTAPTQRPQPTEAEVLAALRGESSNEQLCCDTAEAQRNFESLLTVPGAAALLNLAVDVKASVPQIAAASTEALHRLAPRLLGDSGGDSDKQQLLVSFSERYDALLTRYNALQQKCREMSSRQDDVSDLGQQVDAWKAAHRAATERVEEVTLENGDLRERVRLMRAEGSDPREKQRLLQRLAEREAEIKAAGTALSQLQEVMDDSTSATDARVAELERELAAVRRRAQDAEAELRANAGVTQAARESSAAAERLCAEHEARRIAADREAAENADALEILLEEKGKFLDEREHHIDRRLVASMVANYLDHQASPGEEALAEQVISQLFRVLGGHPRQSDRGRLRSASASKSNGALSAPPASFADWLDMEMAEESVNDPDIGAIAKEVSRD